MSTHTGADLRFLTVAEAATALGVGAPTVRRWVKSGALHAVRPAGPEGVIRIPEAELRRFAEGVH